MDPRLDLRALLRPGNAVAAIITVDRRYLLQLRDAKPDIFFPAQWGCFGGGVEAGETPEISMARELCEELALELPPADFRYFTRFDFDLGFCGLGRIWRIFYEISLDPKQLESLHLKEGADFRLFGSNEVLLEAVPITPYDAFALWFHINRGRLHG